MQFHFTAAAAAVMEEKKRTGAQEKIKPKRGKIKYSFDKEKTFYP